MKAYGTINPNTIIDLYYIYTTVYTYRTLARTHILRLMHDNTSHDTTSIMLTIFEAT